MANELNPAAQRILSALTFHGWTREEAEATIREAMGEQKEPERKIGDRPIAGAHLSDLEVAVQVRALMRDDLDHEAVLVTARDRILYLSEQLAETRDTKRLDFLALSNALSKAEVEQIVNAYRAAKP